MILIIMFLRLTESRITLQALHVLEGSPGPLSLAGAASWAREWEDQVESLEAVGLGVTSTGRRARSLSVSQGRRREGLGSWPEGRDSGWMVGGGGSQRSVSQVSAS